MSLRLHHRLTTLAQWVTTSYEDWLYGLLIDLVLGEAVAALGEAVTCVEVAEATVQDLAGVCDRSRPVRVRVGTFLTALGRRSAREACTRGFEAVLDGLLEVALTVLNGTGC